MPYVKKQPHKSYKDYKEDDCCYDHHQDFYHDYEDGKRWKKKKPVCEQLPGTLLRIFIPAGAVINLLNLLEVTSPTGICLIIRIPLLGGGNNSIATLLDSIKAAGGKVEIVQQ